MVRKTSDAKAIETPFLDTDRAAQYLLISSQTLKNHRMLGSGPTYRRHGGKIVYHQADLDHWSEACSVKRKTRS